MPKKKDYIVAAELRKWTDGSDMNDAIVTRAIAKRLAREFKKENPRFNDIKFLRACGVWSRKDR